MYIKTVYIYYTEISYTRILIKNYNINILLIILGTLIDYIKKEFSAFYLFIYLCHFMQNKERYISDYLRSNCKSSKYLTQFIVLSGFSCRTATILISTSNPKKMWLVLAKIRK